MSHQPLTPCLSLKNAEPGMSPSPGFPEGPGVQGDPCPIAVRTILWTNATVPAPRSNAPNGCPMIGIWRSAEPYGSEKPPTCG